MKYAIKIDSVFFNCMTFTKNAHPLHVIGGIDTMDITKHIIIGGVNAIDITKTSKTVMSTLLTSRNTL
jgi:hypothetical protein